MSIKKQSDISTENGISSFTLTQVERKGKERLLFFGKKKVVLSTEDYLSGYYYPGKKFSPFERELLEEKSRLRKAQDYLSSLLGKKSYCEKEVEDKLKKKFHLSREERERLLSPYRKEGILNDESFAKDFAERKSEEGYGRKYIEAKLRRKGVSLETISRVSAKIEPNREILFSLLSKKDRSLAAKPEKRRKEALFSFLLYRGFSFDEASSLLEDYSSSLPEENVTERRQKKTEYFKKEAEKCYNAVRKKKTDDYHRKASFRSKLIQKGFSSEEIDSFLNERGYKFHD